MKINKFNENINDEGIKVGDYVICKYETNITVSEFTEHNIGIVNKIDINERYPFYVRYENIPDVRKILDETVGTKRNLLIFDKTEILYWSENRIDLEPMVLAKKFNI